jgi:hypothetical protein
MSGVMPSNCSRFSLRSSGLRLLPKYPDIKVELILDNGLTDIVTERYDAGVRMGEHLEKDMVSARIGPDFQLAVVGKPSYFDSKPAPKHPKDLVRHTCINFRLPTSGGLYAWEFEDNGREFKVRVEGQLAFNNPCGRRGAGRLRSGLCAGGDRAALCGARAPDACFEKLFAGLGGLPFVLPEPASFLSGLRDAGGRAAASGEVSDGRALRRSVDGPSHTFNSQQTPTP